MGFPNDSVVKESAWNPEDIGLVGSIHGSRRSPGVGNGNPRQYSCLKNPMDRVTWQATVQRITKSQKRLRATMLTWTLPLYGSKLECFFDPGAFLITFPVTKSFLSSKERSRPDVHSDDFFFHWFGFTTKVWSSKCYSFACFLSLYKENYTTVFSVWLPSFIFVKFMHVVHLYCYIELLYEYNTIYIHSSMKRSSGSFQHGDFMNNASMNIFIIYFMHICMLSHWKILSSRSTGSVHMSLFNIGR